MCHAYMISSSYFNYLSFPSLFTLPIASSTSTKPSPPTITTLLSVSLRSFSPFFPQSLHTPDLKCLKQLLDLYYYLYFTEETESWGSWKLGLGHTAVKKEHIYEHSESKALAFNHPAILPLTLSPNSELPFFPSYAKIPQRKSSKPSFPVRPDGSISCCQAAKMPVWVGLVTEVISSWCTITVWSEQLKWWPAMATLNWPEKCRWKQHNERKLCFQELVIFPPSVCPPFSNHLWKRQAWVN